MVEPHGLLLGIYNLVVRPCDDHGRHSYCAIQPLEFSRSQYREDGFHSGCADLGRPQCKLHGKTSLESGWNRLRRKNPSRYPGCDSPANKRENGIAQSIAQDWDSWLRRDEEAWAKFWKIRSGSHDKPLNELRVPDCQSRRYQSAPGVSGDNWIRNADRLDRALYKIGLGIRAPTSAARTSAVAEAGPVEGYNAIFGAGLAKDAADFPIGGACPVAVQQNHGGSFAAAVGIMQTNAICFDELAFGGI